MTRSFARARILLPIVSAFFAAGFLHAQPAEEPGAGGLSPEPIPTGEALELILSLEQEPLDSLASLRRTVLLGWLFASPDVADLAVDDRYLYGFDTTAHPYREELTLQYLFGAAALRAASGEASPPVRVLAVAGIRSLLAAYRSMLLIDPAMHDQYLEDLDEIRRRGKLDEYVLKVDEWKAAAP